MSTRSIFSRRVILPSSVEPARITIENGIIAEIEPTGSPKSKDTEDFGDLVIMPGLIDSHVHINEPGRTEWEGFNTATRAAARGGITTLVDMPLNSSPVSTHVEALQKKLHSASRELHVNCGFYGGLIPGNLPQLPALLQSGVLGIKAFLTHSGIDEFPNVSEEDLRAAMPLITASNLPLLVHCELDYEHPGLLKLAENPFSYEAYLASRPKAWEDDAIALMIRLGREYGTRVHIVHLSSAEALAEITKARREGLLLSVETCPHYLVFDAETIPDKATAYKCAPPIREKANNDLLWEAITDGIIDFVVTDHSPAPAELKELESGNFQKAWGGIAGLQYSLAAFWTAAEKRNIGVADLAKLMSSRVAEFLGLEKSKGFLKAGYDADIVIWNPEKNANTDARFSEHRHKISPYFGMSLKGEVVETIVNGYSVFHHGEFNHLNKGKIVLR
jgi:allantoinase